jgi:transposase, IS30 family
MVLPQHKQLTVDTTVRVYSCDPQSPWQRGTNEHTNRLLRQYFLKDTTFHATPKQTRTRSPNT